MAENKFEYGMIGLGTMGSNLVLNMQDKGIAVAGYDKNPEAVDNLTNAADSALVKGFKDLAQFVDSLKEPKAILLLVPAGKVVDFVISDLKPLLKAGDIIVDCGNSHFTDTQRRINELSPSDIHFMGMGISGGEAGARYGASMMPGGDESAYKRIAPMLDAVAAKVGGEPCTGYMGKGPAGHYVKMVHNGIEYAMMQLISEAYHLMHVHTSLTNEQMANVFENWNRGPLQSFLIEITSTILRQPADPAPGKLIDYILDTAAQKGTGAWTSEDAMNIGTPVPVIDAAVSQRLISALKTERLTASRFIERSSSNERVNNLDLFLSDLERALFSAFIVTYAQGFALLSNASAHYGFGLKLEKIARIWRGGCIIRAELLNNIAEAYDHTPEMKNLLLEPDFMTTLANSEGALKRIIVKCIQLTVPRPCFSAALNYYESYFSGWLPANLIQAQRDFFGAHTYQRIDIEGTFHTEWNQTAQ